MPFISGEVLRKAPYFRSAGDPLFRREKVVHSAIHDLESLWYVLCHLCLTCDGPGGQRRKEFQPGVVTPNASVRQLQWVVLRLFDDPDSTSLAENKRELFAQPTHLLSHVFPHFSEYFEALKPMLRDWFLVLSIGYRYFDGVQSLLVQEQVVAILKRYRSNFSELAADAKYVSMRDDELERRTKDLELLVASFSERDGPPSPGGSETPGSSPLTSCPESSPPPPPAPPRKRRRLR